MASMDPCFRPRASICECFLGSPVVPSEAGDESNYAEGNIKRSNTWFIICSPAVSEGLRFNSQLPPFDLCICACVQFLSPDRKVRVILR